MRDVSDPWTPNLERALRWAAQGHDGQVRKGSPVPYIEHPMAVAMILDRAGFPDEVVIAGLLHDLVEDTDVTRDDVRDPGSARPWRRPWRAAPRSSATPKASNAPGPTGSGTIWKFSRDRPRPRRPSRSPTSSTTSPASRWTSTRDAPSGRRSTPGGRTSWPTGSAPSWRRAARGDPRLETLARQAAGDAGAGPGPLLADNRSEKISSEADYPVDRADRVVIVDMSATRHTRVDSGSVQNVARRTSARSRARLASGGPGTSCRQGGECECSDTQTRLA